MVAEAMILLVVARLLIAAVRFRYWRASLGTRALAGAADRSTLADVSTARMIAAAVNRAAQRLHIEMKCLPRAMAVQWMLKRRGLAAKLIFGVANGRAAGQRHDLHAWVEVGGIKVIGGHIDRDFRDGLILTSSRS